MKKAIVVIGLIIVVVIGLLLLHNFKKSNERYKRNSEILGQYCSHLPANVMSEINAYCLSQQFNDIEIDRCVRNICVNAISKVLG